MLPWLLITIWYVTMVTDYNMVCYHGYSLQYGMLPWLLITIWYVTMVTHYNMMFPSLPNKHYR